MGYENGNHLRFRKGENDPRERYSTRVHLLIFDGENSGDPEIFAVIEFAEHGAPVGRDLYSDLADAEKGFDATVHHIELQDEVRVVPLY